MIVGDCSVFALECGILQALESPSQLALGHFVIHVGGRIFGVQEPDATLLGCSFREVEQRLARRGRHVWPILAEVDAGDIADAYLDAIYRDTSRTDYLGLSQQDFIDSLHSHGVIWAPDGDAAFDDGSHVLQFDVAGRVRIVAFANEEIPDAVSGTVREVWMDSEIFYGILSRLVAQFASDRAEELEALTRPLI